MFTIEQIKEAHSKVKSGADFPKYIQDLEQLGVISYTCYVSDGCTKYNGSSDYSATSDAKYNALTIAKSGNITALKNALSIHQQGQTDYLTFCKQSAEAGVEKWVVDIDAMTCIYFDKDGGEMVKEVIPGD